MAKSIYERVRTIVDKEAPGSVIENYYAEYGKLGIQVTIQTKGPGQVRTTINASACSFKQFKDGTLNVRRNPREKKWSRKCSKRF